LLLRKGGFFIIKRIFSFGFILVFCLMSSLPAMAETDVRKVTAVDIQGNKTISTATILAKIKTRVGQEYRQSVLSDDLKRLYNTGYFSDVRVDRQEYKGGFKVIIYLEEKSVVEDVSFSRTRYIKKQAIKKKIKTRPGRFLDKKTLKGDVRLIKELYAKKGLMDVRVRVETEPNEITGKTRVRFIIQEGERQKITRIRVEGNRHFKKKKILRLIKTRKKTLFNSGIFKREQLDEDMERIESFYEKQGFIDVRAGYTVKFLSKSRVRVDIKIDEGRQYFVGEVVITGNQVVSTGEIRQIMKEIRPGVPFSREKLGVDITNIRTLYFDKGYIFADVRPSTAVDPQTGQVTVKVTVTEGSVAYINEINIVGNTRTRDIVIRRELRLWPGDRFDGTKLRRSKERLHNLGYFDEINFDIEDTDQYDRKDLVVQVKEAKTGSFSFGGGFSTVDQLVGFIAIEQRNFDITNWPTFTGGGQRLQLRAETGSTKNNLLLSFTEPWIFDYPVSGGFDAYKKTRNRERDVGYAYDQQRVGGNIRLGRRFTEYVSGTVFYRYEDVTIDNLAHNVSADLLAEKGSNVVSQVGFSLTRDSRDSIFSPTRGLAVTTNMDVAGSILGGDKEFYRVQTRASYYIPLKFRAVLELRGRVGIVDAFGDSEKVPIFERFFTGGARSIRGYDERQVGPLDAVTKDPIGGEGLLVGNIELTIPVVDFVKLAAFFDTGNVWADLKDFAPGDLKSGMGVGVRVKTPIGPVNLDYGYPLNEEPGEDSRSGKFYFSVSRGF